MTVPVVIRQHQRVWELRYRCRIDLTFECPQSRSPVHIMKSSSSGILALFFGALISYLGVTTTAFAPQPRVSVHSNPRVSTHLNIFDEKERQALTRDSEPEDYFQT
jgi:hypothetical protein